MPLIQLIIWLVVVGLILWLINQLPIDANIKRIITVVLTVIVILWLIALFLPGLATWGPRVGHP